jgi:hypothetical protein
VIINAPFSLSPFLVLVAFNNDDNNDLLYQRQQLRYSVLNSNIQDSMPVFHHLLFISPSWSSHHKYNWFAIKISIPM